MHASWPSPGEKTWAIQQPTHTLKYLDFEGTIEGYGKGEVSLHARDKTEIVSSRPGHVSFNIYKGTGPEEYTLHRVHDKNWVLYNRTTHRTQHPDLPDSKPTYKETTVEKAPIQDPDIIFSAKIDDAHNLFYFPEAGQQIRVVSYRPSKKGATGLIEHTHKVPSIHGIPTPTGLGNTILRGGLYAISPETGKATPAHILAGMLNTDVWKSREKQKQHGELLPVLYDVVRYRGKDLDKAPYEQKLKVLREVESKLPDIFHLPRMATTPEAKKQLLEDIRAGNIPETEEGVVAWHLKESRPAVKVKFKQDHDVYLKEFFPGEGKYKGKGVGGFLYSHTPDGPIVGRVGTGLSDELRKDMHDEPKKYLGMVARVEAQAKYPSGALRSPAFQGWHLDKNDELQLSSIKMASAELYSLCFLWGQAIA
jgi:hypothetical protein